MKLRDTFYILAVSIVLGNSAWCSARWYNQDRTGTGRNLRMMSPRSYTSDPQWNLDRWNNRAWYTIPRAPRGYYHLDEYSDEWCPDCKR